MNMIKTALAITVSVVIMMQICCTKKDLPENPYYYDYFPIITGSWIVYDVDSIVYDELNNRVDTFYFRIRETVKEKYIDNTGAIAYRVVQEKKRDTLAWHVNRVISHKRDKRTAERVEEGLRYIKLVFPVRPYTSWKGNAYITYDDPWHCNFLGDWEYEYMSINEPYAINGFLFDSSLVVQQVADSGLICKNYAVEVYAKNVGLVYKYTERLTTQKITPEPFYLRAENGFIVTYSLVNYFINSQ